MNESLKLQFPPNLDFLNLLNSLCREIALVWNLDEKTKDRLESSVLESCVNSIKYFESNTLESVNLEFEKSQKFLSVKIKNPGTMIPESAFKEPDFDIHPEGGYGLYIIKSLTDKFIYKYENGINLIEFQLNI